jgi:hypothetical protein
MTKEQRRVWRKKNPDKHKAEQKKYYHNHKKQVRRRHLKFLFWTEEMYEKVKKKQKGRCAICGIKDAHLSADHDHESEVPRGLLCRLCNLMLGCAKDTPRILKKAAAYLKKFM